MAEAALSCADIVYLGCAVDSDPVLPFSGSRDDGKVRESYAKIRPFSNDICQGVREL